MGLIKELGLVNIFDTDEDELEPLKQQIVKHDGQVHVFVHLLSERLTPQILALPSYRTLANGLTQYRQEGLPIIFAEEPRKSFDLPQAFSLSSIEQPIYLLETRANDPHPVPPITWSNLIQLFKGLEIQKVILGGMYLRYDNIQYLSDERLDRIKGRLAEDSEVSRYITMRRFDFNNLLPQGCVGDLALRLLEGGIDFDFSHLCLKTDKNLVEPSYLIRG